MSLHGNRLICHQERRRSEVATVNLPPAQAILMLATTRGPRMHHLAMAHLICHSQDPSLFQLVQLSFLRS